MFSDDSLNLSPEATAELRGEHFNVKRWVSRAMADAKKRRPPSANGADEATAQQLVTVLGVRKQAAAESLEDTISGALRYFPRASEDISRLAVETTATRAELQKVASTAASIRDASGVSDRLKDLHVSRERLVRCRSVLSDAQLLSSRVAAVEDSLAAMPGLGGASPRPTGAPSPSSTPALSSADMAEYSRIAEDIATMRGALRTLQAIDPSYGAAVRAQVDRCEQQMQRGLEQQCLDALRKENRTAAPTLLAALGKIGREAGVLKTHTDEFVKARIDTLKADVLGLKAHPDKCVSALRKCLASLVASLTKERAYLLDVLPPAPHTTAPDAPAAASTSRSKASVSEPASGGQVFLRVLTDVVAAVGPMLDDVLHAAGDDNTRAVAMLDAVHAKLVGPLVATLTVLPLGAAALYAEGLHRRRRCARHRLA